MSQDSDIIGIIEGPLRRFSVTSAELIRNLERDVDLSEEDRLSVENHFLKLHLAYVEWKRRKIASDQASAAPFDDHEN